MSSMLPTRDLRSLSSDIAEQVLTYLGERASACARQQPDTGETAASDNLQPDQQAIEIFRLLTSKRFCYLSRRRVEKYSEQTIGLIRDRIERDEPVHFYYDIGGGYRASIQEDFGNLSYSLGLTEFFFLHQIVSLNKCVRSVYAPGARFTFVVDNLCAYFVNDIAIRATEDYCRSLRELISAMDLPLSVEVLVESERLSVNDYKADIDAIQQPPSTRLATPAETENVSRFLGRACGRDEAAARMALYERVIAVSESRLSGLVRGIRLTQRATETTLCFRPFPGGDARTQAGHVALTVDSKQNVRPILVTSRNVANYSLETMTLSPAMYGLIDSASVAIPRQ